MCQCWKLHAVAAAGLCRSWLRIYVTRAYLSLHNGCAFFQTGNDVHQKLWKEGAAEKLQKTLRRTTFINYDFKSLQLTRFLPSATRLVAYLGESFRTTTSFIVSINVTSYNDIERDLLQILLLVTGCRIVAFVSYTPMHLSTSAMWTFDFMRSRTANLQRPLGILACWKFCSFFSFQSDDQSGVNKQFRALFNNPEGGFKEKAWLLTLLQQQVFFLYISKKKKCITTLVYTHV